VVSGLEVEWQFVVKGLVLITAVALQTVGRRS
jgi:ABC-type xylose transport system permease subunit